MKKNYIFVIEIHREGFLFQSRQDESVIDLYISKLFDYFSPNTYSSIFKELELLGTYRINGNHLYAGSMDSFRTNGARTVYIKEINKNFDSALFLRERENCSSPLDHLSVSEQDQLQSFFPKICNLAN